MPSLFTCVCAGAIVDIILLCRLPLLLLNTTKLRARPPGHPPGWRQATRRARAAAGPRDTVVRRHPRRQAATATKRAVNRQQREVGGGREVAG